jgi:hypothetical protein
VSEHLEATVNVTLDGAGVGVVTTGPGRQGETWSVARYTTSGASAIDPRLDVFRGSAGLLDTTNHGNQDVSETTAPVVLHGGEFLSMRYTGGTPGAVMTFYLEGTRDYA